MPVSPARPTIEKAGRRRQSGLAGQRSHPGHAMAGICDSLANTLSRAGIPQAAMAVNDSPAFPPSPAPSSTAAVRRNHQRLLRTGFAVLLSLAIGERKSVV